MDLDKYFADLHGHEERSIVRMPEGWGQGRAVFGGLVAAVMMRAVERRRRDGERVRSILLNFIAPVQPGELDISITCLRQGKSVSFYKVEAGQDGNIAVIMQVTLGLARDEQLQMQALRPHNLTSPESAIVLPYLPGVTPEFTRHFDYRWAEGPMPYTSSGEAHIGGWIRFRQSPVAVMPAYLLMLSDAWPPACLSLLSAPTAASSMSWSMDFPQQTTALPGAEWLRYQSRLDYAEEGFASVDDALYAPDGQLLMRSRQVVAVFVK